ncbi:MAG: hypothetical protein ACI304_05040 [Lepagella sp.]
MSTKCNMIQRQDIQNYLHPIPANPNYCKNPVIPYNTPTTIPLPSPLSLPFLSL